MSSLNLEEIRTRALEDAVQFSSKGESAPVEVAFAVNIANLLAVCVEIDILNEDLDLLRNLLTELLSATDPYPGSLEEHDAFGEVDLALLWERLAQAVGFKRSAVEGSPTKWDKK